MKILQVNCVYMKGSTGKIVFDIHSGLKKNDIISVICYGRGEKIKEKGVYKTGNEYVCKFNNILSRLTGIQYGGCLISTYNLFKIIKKEKPNIIHLHCLNGFFVNIYRLLSFLNKNKIKTILTLHAEFMYTGNCSHACECERWKKGCGKCPRLKEATRSWLFDRTHTSWRRMQKSIERFDDLVVVSVSPWLQKRAEQSPILKNQKHITILNGINTTEVFKPQDATYLREKHGLKTEKVILHVTANFNDPIKGGRYIIELAETLKKENIRIMIIGGGMSPDNLPNNIIWVGRIENQKELATYYSLANICVLTSKRETFSMVVAESLCCGTPVVGFNAGAPEQITLKEYSDFFEFGKMDVFKENVLKWINTNVDAEELHRIAEKKYSRDRMIQDYLKIYKGI